MELHTLVDTVYLLSAVTFVLGLKLMNDPATARQGNLVSGIGVVAAVIVTLMDARVERFEYVAGGLALGAAAGWYAVSRSPLSGLPRLTGLLNGFGGLAGWLVAWAEFHAHPAGQGLFGGIALWLTAVLGCLSFAGSLTAWARTQEGNIGGNPVRYAGQHHVARAVLLAVLLTGVLFALDTVAPAAYRYFALFSLLSLLMGVLFVLPASGAGLPATICTLNACTGFAACAAGFVYQNMLLVAAGALTGAGGIRLMLVVCKASGCDFAGVLAGVFRAPAGGR